MVRIYTEQDSVKCQPTASRMKLGKLKTEMLHHVSHFTEKDTAELAIPRESASTGTSVADHSFHWDTAEQTFTGKDKESST